MKIKLMNVKLMNVKLFFTFGTAMMLLPLLSYQTQAKAETQPTSIIVRCDHLAQNRFVQDYFIPDHVATDQSESYAAQHEHEHVYESQDFFEDTETQHTQTQHTATQHTQTQHRDGAHHHHHHSTYHSSHSGQNRSTIREILRDRPSTYTDTHSFTIEIQGQCNDLQLEVEPSSSRSHPPLPLPYPNNQSQPPSIEQYLEWYEDQLMEENIPWILRPGSGWHWLLRDRSHTSTPPQNTP